MFSAALTGSIATGKSTVGQMFRDLGASVLEADAMARRVVESPSPLLSRLAHAFGPDILDKQGNLRRRHLREIIFADASARSKLNQMLHPAIREMLQTEIERITDPQAIILLDVPLLFESGWDSDFSTIILVYTPEEMQIERLMRRDCLDERAARSAVDAQWPIEEKKRKAQFIVDNSKLLPETLAQVHDVWLALQKLSAKKPS